MDVFLEKADDHNRMSSFGKIVVVAIAGNESGADHCHAEVCHALNEVGFTIPAGAGTCRVGEAMGSTDDKDLKKPHAKIVQTARMPASNAMHLAGLLQASRYSGVKSSLVSG